MILLEEVYYINDHHLHLPLVRCEVLIGGICMTIRKSKNPIKRKSSPAKTKGKSRGLKTPILKKTVYQEDRLFRTIVENSSDIITIVGSDGKIEFVSPSIKRILGSNPKDLIGKRFTQFIYPDDAKYISSLVAKVFKTREAVYLGEFRIKKSDGSVRIFEGISQGIVDPSGKIKLIANAHDITDRKLAEEKMFQKEEFYRIIADAAHDMIFQIDKNDVVEYINAFGAKQLGKKPEDIIGKPREMLFPKYVSKRQEDRLKKVFVSGTPLYFANEIPFPTGRMFLDTWLVPIKDDSGNAKSVFGISRDATSSRLVQEELEKRTKEAEESGAKAQMYFDFLAHDIANLVSPIFSYSETIQSRPDIPPEIMGFASKIVEQSKQMASFIHNLRMLAEAEKVLPQNADPLDLRSMLMEMGVAMKKESNKSFKATFDVPSAGKIEVIGGIHMRNAIMLGFSNAIRGRLEGDIQMEIKMVPVKKSDGKSFWQMRASLPNHLLSSEFRNVLSTPFNPIKRFKRRSANDLSFAIAIIEHFGGRVWSEDISPSDPSKGYTVVAELPRATGWSSEQSTQPT
jgi:PAS domain S-box-containing protein